MRERWVGHWTNRNILTPSSFVFSSTSFSFCWAAQSGVLRAHNPLLGAGSHYSILSPTNWLQTNWTSCRTAFYHCLTLTCFLWASHFIQFNPSTVKAISDIFDRMHLLFAQLHFLFWQFGRGSIYYIHFFKCQLSIVWNRFCNKNYFNLKDIFWAI